MVNPNQMYEDLLDIQDAMSGRPNPEREEETRRRRRLIQAKINTAQNRATQSAEELHGATNGDDS